MSDNGAYEYPDRVCYDISQDDQDAYRQAADYINTSGYDVLSVQHEYGIFGGKAGSYLMNLVRAAKMPIVTTLHTVLKDPNPEQKAVTKSLLKRSTSSLTESRRSTKRQDKISEPLSGSMVR